MYNLTSKKYIFFGISLLIIVPGLLSLIFWRLNPGIDFTGGTTVDLHFPTAISSSASNDITSAFSKAANAKDTKIYFSREQGATDGSIVYWVKLDRAVDSTVQKAILDRFGNTTLFGTVKPLAPLNVPATSSAGTSVGLLPFLFTPPQKTTGGPAFTIPLAQVQSALTASPLPNTGVVASTASTAVVVPTVVAATPVATTTASSTTTTPATNTSTTPVKLVDVIGGTPNQAQVVTVQSQTQITPDKLQNALTLLLPTYKAVYTSQVQSVGPSIASSTTFWAVMAVVLASVFIMLYVGFAFRNVGGIIDGLRYGACAIVALLHDALVVLGIWSILGHFFPNEFKVDTLFVTAVLTVIGFSVHDTIVVFDRIRENAQRRSAETFNDIVNASLLQTMARSLNTSLTVLITLSALTLFGGASIRSFTLALLIGIFSGTYSSIFNASMLLVVWETGEWRTWFGGKANEGHMGMTMRGVQRVARSNNR